MAAARAFAGRYADEMNVTVLVDFENDSVRTALDVAAALGPRLWGVRLDTSGHGSPTEPRAAVRRRGADRASRRSSSGSSRAELDANGFHAVRIVASGGFDATRIRAFEAAEVPVDSYGVGSSLSAARTTSPPTSSWSTGGRARRWGGS